MKTLMMRREAFGGLIYDVKERKSYQVDKIQCRILELLIEKKPIKEILSTIKKEFNQTLTTADLDSFKEKSKQISLRDSKYKKTIWKKGHDERFLSAPLTVYWSFTNICNLHCTHCAWDSGCSNKNEINFQQARKIIDEACKMGVFELSFSGGEPLVKKDLLFQMINYSSKKGFSIRLATNGTMVTKEIAKQFKKAGLCEIQVSFEGLKAHEKVRGKGTLERTMSGLKNLIEVGFDTILSVTVSKMNVGEIEDTINLALKLGVPRIRFVRFVPIGRGKVNLDEFILDKNLEIEAAKLLLKKKRELVGKLDISFNKQYLYSALKNKSNTGWGWDCPSGRSRLNIASDGTVSPCPLLGSLDIKTEDVRKSSLEKIWNESPLFTQIRKEKREEEGSCKSCSNWKFCRGGCKAASYAIHGNLMAPDPICNYEKE